MAIAESARRTETRNIALDSLSILCSSEPQFDVTLGPAADELHVASIPNFVVAARKKRTLLVAEVRCPFERALRSHAGSTHKVQRRPHSG